MGEIVVESGIPRARLIAYFAEAASNREENCFRGDGWQVQVDAEQVVYMGALAITRTKLRISGANSGRILADYRLRFLSAGG
ncbi:MAG: hypothetical protein FH749_13705 [Firmicutes bacterium]|nr:hypothetical protein [Bacillota bacterium]